MSDVRARLAEALHAHALWLLRKEAGHLADVLLSLPDIAIVELPEATGDCPLVDGIEWRFHYAHSPRLVVWTAPGSSVMVQNVEPGDLKPDQARALAAALLAAANAAEQVTP